VRPGLTCIWQVSGRADVPFEGQVQMDVEYVDSHGFWLDLKLVAYTVPAVISGRGAY
jgi:lipopolysaccharide/colanic/teichoic acid biosynthesis glycosyltransferase